MIFSATQFPGVQIIDIEPLSDERGFFARGWCVREFQEHGLDARLVQTNVSFNTRSGTLRGLHYQVEPHAETKVVRCTSGAIFDVVVDIREGSQTFGQWLAVELTALNRRMLYVPPGFAHGFQTLTNNTEVFYQMSEFFVPAAARGLRWDDPAFSIQWPPIIDERIISQKDQSYPLVSRPSLEAP